MAWQELRWTTALAEAGCFGFLEPVASRAVDRALELCPEASPLVDNDARKDLRDICLSRLSIVFERPLTQLAIRRLGFAGSLALGMGDEVRAKTMRDAAEAVRREVAADSGESLRARLPLAEGYERAMADNYSCSVAELLDRLLLRRDDVSRELLGGQPITRITGLCDAGDLHRHGRTVMRVSTNAGTFFYKPHDCGLDALFLELVGTWFPDCVRTARLVTGDGYAFVERLVPEGLSSEEELHTYWHNFGCLTALFHALGSRDMTLDNVMCCGSRPAVLDLELLLTGKMGFDEKSMTVGAVAGITSAETLADSVVCTSVLPAQIGGPPSSPLVHDNSSGSCLPRVGDRPRTVRGYETDFCEGFEQGYRHLMKHRGEVLETLGSHANATCRQILLNTWAYTKSRSLLFSPGAMSDQGHCDKVLSDLNATYAVFSQELQQLVAEPDALALGEGDIPYYCSHVASRTLYTGDGHAMGDLLAQSALEVATGRLERLSEDDLAFELDIIYRCLEEDSR